MTSSGVIGLPSWKRARGRSWKVAEEKSAGCAPIGDRPYRWRLVGAAEHQGIVISHSPAAGCP